MRWPVECLCVCGVKRVSVLVWYLLCEGLGQCLDQLARPLQLVVLAVLELEQMLEEGTATLSRTHRHGLSHGSHESGCVVVSR